MTEDRSNMRSKASMFANISVTASGSVPSQRRAAMQPCSSLLTMDLVHSSTIFFSFFERDSETRAMVFSSSVVRMDSALVRRALMVGTVARESRQDSNSSCSSCSSTSASRAACCRLAVLAATTSLRSSTLYTWASPSSSLTSEEMSRGTAMSKKRRRPPTAALAAGRPTRDSLVISSSAALLAVKMVSHSAMVSLRRSMRRMSTVTSGNSAASS
mmetsp:Transcript_15043/g.45450  ORF Transcript_15043/g.45450 Transcript_15043/m.45450 type:complete len:215 (-) Transcript_15043:1075-1719(-)